MEYLDIYDENEKHIGKEEREIVHRDALWHKTVHCWLYDAQGNVYFQIRKKEDKLYTTASGHILAGETVKQGFGREIKEEIGIDVNYEEAQFVYVYKFVMDKEKSDGTVFRDRAFSNVYICEYEGKDEDFKFDPEELNGLVKVNAKEVLDILQNEHGKLNGTVIRYGEKKNTIENKIICFEDFLVNKGETAIEKYGKILKKIVEVTK